MEDIRQDMRICGWVDGDIISDKMKWRQKIRVVDPICEKVKVKIKMKKRKSYIIHKWYTIKEKSVTIMFGKKMFLKLVQVFENKFIKKSYTHLFYTRVFFCY